MANIWDTLKPDNYENFDKTLGGVPTMIAQNYDPAKYTARKAASASGQPEASYGAAGLPGLASMVSAIPGASGALGGAGMLAGPLLASAAVPAAAAYGIGKLIAPKQTDIAVQKIRDFIQNRVAPVVKKGEAVGSAYETGMGESIPGSRLVEKALPAQWQQKMELVKAQNPGAAIAGQAAGTIGQLAIPGVTLLKGVTGLGKIGAAAGNAAINALPYAAGAGLNTYADTGDIGQAVKSGLTTEGTAGILGGALGGIAGKIEQKLPGLASTVKKGAEDTYIREALNIDPKSFKNVASFHNKLKGQAAQDAANQLRNNLVELGNSQGIADKTTRENWLAGQAQKWKGVDQAWNASGKKVSDFTDQIVSHPEVQNFVQDNGAAGQQVLNDLISTADQKSNIVGVRNFLQKKIDYSYSPGATFLDKDTANAARAIRDTVDSAFVPPELKGDYAQYKVLNDAITHKDLRLESAPFTVGSQTAGRMLGSGIAGGVLGGTTGLDTSDPNWLGKTLKRSALGAVIGSVAPRLGVMAANKGLGALAGKIAPMIPEIGAQAGNAADKFSLLGSRIAGLGTQNLTKNAAPISGTPLSMAPTQPGAVNASLQMPGQTQAEQQVKASTSQTESALPQNQVGQAKTQVNTQWADEIRNRLDDIYDAEIAPIYGDTVSKDQFIGDVQKLTKNFDPHYTAGYIFADNAQRLAYLKSYDAALKLQGMNVDEALQSANVTGVNPLEHPGVGAEMANVLTGGVGQAFGGGGMRTQQSQMANDQLKNIMLQAITPYGSAPDPGKRKEISQQIDYVTSLRIPMAMKLQNLRHLLANYGIDYDQLMKYGLRDIGVPQTTSALGPNA